MSYVSITLVVFVHMMLLLKDDEGALPSPFFFPQFGSHPKVWYTDRTHVTCFMYLPILQVSFQTDIAKVVSSRIGFIWRFDFFSPKRCSKHLFCFFLYIFIRKLQSSFHPLSHHNCAMTHSHFTYILFLIIIPIPSMGTISPWSPWHLIWCGVLLIYQSILTYTWRHV